MPDRAILPIVLVVFFSQAPAPLPHGIWSHVIRRPARAGPGSRTYFQPRD
jgi:hypothetical protein